MVSPDTSKSLRTEAPTSGRDELDDIFDYDAGGVDDPFGDNYQSSVAKAKPRDTPGVGKGANGLGIDEEVEVTRKPRAPRVKLDEHRLLSAAGIPKLRKRAKDHLKFKGRGHEYSDASRLLSFYQLWLDDLFPKARFLDALAMVEKTGHKKLIQAARLGWINEGKRGSSVHEDSVFDNPEPSRESEGHGQSSIKIAPIFEKTPTARPKTPTASIDIENDESDLYNATPRTRKAEGGIENGAASAGKKSLFGSADDDDIPDDDLDALLAEEEALQAGSGNKVPEISVKKIAPIEDNFDDEMEAMAEMEGMW